MEIKRRLNKIASNLSPQIEALNIAEEMKRMCTRFEELIAYGQEKVDRAGRKGETIGQKVAKQKAAELKEIEDHQRAEAEENLRDQEESFKERNAKLEKSQKPTERDVADDMIEGFAETADGTIMADPGMTVPDDQVGVTDEQLNPSKKKAKKKRGRPRKKK